MTGKIESRIVPSFGCKTRGPHYGCRTKPPQASAPRSWAEVRNNSDKADKNKTERRQAGKAKKNQQQDEGKAERRQARQEEGEEEALMMGDHERKCARTMSPNEYKQVTAQSPTQSQQKRNNQSEKTPKTKEYKHQPKTHAPGFRVEASMP